MKNRLKIGSKWVGENARCFISLEASSTFTNFEEAKKLTEIAASSGADAIKFQNLFPGDAERILGKPDLKVDFSTPTGKKQELMYDAIKRRELSENNWRELANHAKNLGLLFITTPYFPEALDLITKISGDAIKVNKGDINNVLFIEQIAKTNLPVLLDGREKFSDVDTAIKICENNNNEQIVIMHCPSGYPSENAGVHLRAINAIKEKYDYPIGFADHSLGSIMNFAAIGLGVSMIEKTITLDKTKEQSEHYMSLEPQELPSFINDIRAVEDAMGDPDILKSSRVNQNLRRCFVAKQDIKKGQKVVRDVLDYQRPGDAGISCSEGFTLLEKTAQMDIPKGTFLQWNMFE